ncbi:MAG TPA: amidohydrolase family protein [Terriglobales bacterium]|nr:amidohydrolase family protein [Terriglobales bacterium]
MPTLSVAHVFGSVGSQAIYQDSRLQYVSPQIRESWQNNPIVHIEIPEYVAGRKRAFEEALHMTRAAHKAGVPFLAGTDSGGVPYLYYGFSLHDELALLVQADFTPMEALQAAALKPAQFLGIADQLGTITEGKQADLVLLEANPLDDIRNTRRIHAVVVRGHYLDRAALDALLNQAKSAASH